MKSIYIVGSINTDLVIETPYIPKGGETLTGNGFFTAHGGKGANQAVSAARLGGKVFMCGAVGDDDFGKSAIDSLKQDNINTDCVKVVKNTPTGTAVIILCNGDNRIIIDKGANACLSTQDIDKFLSNAKAGDIFLTQLENPIDVIGYGLEKAKEKGMRVILNPAPANVEIKPYLKYCDLVTPNETEIEIMGGYKNVLENVDKILVTLGSKGFQIITKECSKSYPCVNVKAVDTTAAGDTLCGGLVAYLAEDYSLEDSAKFGSLSASIACTRKGAQPSIPTRKEVINFK